jgi:hypothetical protein
MKRFQKSVVGGLLAVTLTLGVSGVALAATTGSTTSTSPSTTSPSTSSPSTTSPSSSGPSKSRSAKTNVLTGNEIWRIVEPHHRIYCADAAKEIKRIQVADAAAARRASADESRTTNGPRDNGHALHGRNAARRAKRNAAAVRGFQKLQQDGLALIARIDAKCSGKSTTT